MGIQLPQSHHHQPSTVPLPRVSDTSSREANEQVRVIASNATTSRVEEGQPGTIPAPSSCPSGFTATLLPQKYRDLLRHLYSGMPQLGFPDLGSAWWDPEQASSTPA